MVGNINFGITEISEIFDSVRFKLEINNSFFVTMWIKVKVNMKNLI